MELAQPVGGDDVEVVEEVDVVPIKDTFFGNNSSYTSYPAFLSL